MEAFFTIGSNGLLTLFSLSYFNSIHKKTGEIILQLYHGKFVCTVNHDMYKDRSWSRSQRGELDFIVGM
jgi:hypothetical protein